MRKANETHITYEKKYGGTNLNMKKRHFIRNGKRVLAFVLSLCIVGTSVPFSIYAETGSSMEADASETLWSAVSGSNAEERTERKGKLITEWEWIDEEENLDPETGALLLSATEEEPAFFSDVTALLPKKLFIEYETASASNAENGKTAEKTLSIKGWRCDAYPETGGYEGTYFFEAQLPNGYTLSEDAEVLTAEVRFDSGMVLKLDGYDLNGFCVNFELDENGEFKRKEGGECTHQEGGCNGYQPALQEDSVYQIGNAGQLFWFIKKVAGEDRWIKGALTKDIIINKDLMDAIEEDGTIKEGKRKSVRRWIDSGMFYGEFDGNGHSIKGLYVNKDMDSNTYGGLFSSLGEYLIVRYVKNVTIEDSYICAQYAGGICGGMSTNSSIINCHNKGAVKGRYAGGICGIGSGKEITDCSNSGTITEVGKSGYAGGICGIRSTSEILNCYNTGKVMTKEDGVFLGGICGSQEGLDGGIKQCYNIGEVKADSRECLVGGISGQTSSAIEECYNRGTVIGKDSTIGGIVGGNIGYRGSIHDCYNSGEVIGEGESSVYGVSGGDYYSDNVSNCYFDKTVCGSIQGIYRNHPGAVGKSTAEFASGYVAYLLNRENSDEDALWHQNLDAEGKEKEIYPVLDSTHGDVYPCTSGCAAVCSNEDGTEGEHFLHFIENDDTDIIEVKCPCGEKEYGSMTADAPVGENLVYNGQGKYIYTRFYQIDPFFTDRAEIRYFALDQDDTAGTDNAPSNAGSYRAEVSMHAEGEKAKVSISFVIRKAVPYLVSAPEASAITYGETLESSVLSGGSAAYSESDSTAVKGTFVWADQSQKPELSDSETTEYRVIFKPDEEGNYETVETKVKLKVKEKPASGGESSVPDPDTPSKDEPSKDNSSDSGNGSGGSTGNSTGNSTGGSISYDKKKGYVDSEKGIITGGGNGNQTSSSWVRDEKGWWFRYADGSYPKGSSGGGAGGALTANTYQWERINGSWWAFDANGYLVIGWLLDQNGRWYHVDENRGMTTGWFLDLRDGKWYYLNPETGAMAVGWRLIDGKWYYLDPASSAMLRNTTTPDGYYVGEDGSYIE